MIYYAELQLYVLCIYFMVYAEEEEEEPVIESRSSANR